MRLPAMPSAHRQAAAQPAVSPASLPMGGLAPAAPAIPALPELRGGAHHQARGYAAKRLAAPFRTAEYADGRSGAGEGTMSVSQKDTKATSRGRRREPVA